MYTQACLVFPLKILRERCSVSFVCLIRETVKLLRNKTKTQKVFVPEPYTYKLGVTSVKLIENSLMMKEIITWLYV